MPPSRDSPPQRPSSSLLQPPAQETPGGPGSTSRTTTTTSTTTTSTPTTTTTTHTRPRGTTSPAPTTTTTTTTYAPITSPSPSSHLRPRFSSVSSASSSRPSIRIRRFPSYQSTSQTNLPTLSTPSATSDEVPAASAEQDFVGSGRSSGGRRRSFSDPQRSYVPPQDGNRARGLSTRPSHGHMPEITEGASTSNLPLPPPAERLPPQAQQNPTLKRKSRSRLFRTRSREEDSVTDQEHSEYDSGLVDYLDLVDPEVSTLNTLTNVQNSLFIPDLGWLVNRRPTYTLTRRPSESTVPQQAPPADGTIPEHPDAEAEAEGMGPLERTDTLTSITSRPSSTHYAVLPHGVALDGWSAEDRQELNDHVRHMLHSKRSRFKRSMKGFGQYVRRPLGFFVTLYATLITLFGLAWVLFLIGWVNVGGKQEYLIDIIDNIMVALFAIMGDGLAPFRAVDTYHMCFIAHYHHLTWRLRREKALPKLQNKNDLPPLPPSDTDLEGGAKTEEDEFSVLTEKQQKRLVHHQNKFAKSHTFYKPHETATHHAFPLRLLVAVVCLLDCHSLLQIALGTCTWSIDYHVRPFALTTVILCCSITVNISAGVVIMIGDRRTRKKDVLEKMHKQELTAEAMAKLAKKREKEREKSRTLLEPVPPPLSAETTKPLPDDPEGMAEEREKHMSPPTSPTTPTSPVARKPLPIAKRGDGVPSSPTSPTGMSKIRNIDTIPTSTLNLAKEKEF